MPLTLISNKRRLLEILAVVLTATGKFFFMDYLNWKLLFVVVAIFGWISYIIYRNKATKDVSYYWGFRIDNFRTVSRKMLPFGLLSVAIFICIGVYRNTINISWHIIPILILYPIWGIIQQFLLIALTAGNLQDIKGHPFNKAAIIVFSALLFAAVHYPFIELIIATFILVVFYEVIYLKERNIYMLGLFHGWLGGFFYYMVLGRDPFLEVFGKVFHLTN